MNIFGDVPYITQTDYKKNSTVSRTPAPEVYQNCTRDLENAIAASNAFFSPSMDELKKLDEKTFLEVFDGVPQAEISKEELSEGIDMIAALSAKTNFLASNSDARRELKQNAISLNKEKVAEDYKISSADLINNQFLLLQKGKKNYYVIKIV